MPDLTSPPAAGTRPAEGTQPHNRLQKLALGLEESRAYWRHARRGESAARQNERAFEERWFGAKSPERVRVILADMRARYDAVPAALDVLSGWREMEPETRRLICHWHLQFSDPIYRRFTGAWLPERRRMSEAAAPLAFPSVLRWVLDTNPKGWLPSTCRQVAGKLLSAASEAGLVTPAPDPRRPLSPRVPETALAYLLHLLREIDIEGNIFENSYLGSIGLSGLFLEQRLSLVQWAKLSRIGSPMQVEWTYPSLRAWAEAEL